MVLSMIFDKCLILVRILGVSGQQVILIGCTFVVSMIGWMGFIVHKQYGPVVAGALLLTIILTIYRRLNNYAGYGTPPLNVRPMIHQKELVANKAVRVFALTDTHDMVFSQEHCDLLPDDAEVLIHCGDAVDFGTIEEFEKFNNWLGMVAERKKNFLYRICIAGNHCLMLDPTTYENNISFLKHSRREMHTEHKSMPFFQKNASTPAAKKNYKQVIVSQILSNATHYLENETVTLAIPGKGTITIAGSPVTEVQPQASMQSFARNDVEQTAAFQQTFANVPKGKHVDVFMTHGPPKNVLDRTFFGKKVGSPSLSKFLVRLAKEDRAPKYMVFGHIHEGRGVLHADTVLASELLEGVHGLYSNKNLKKGGVEQLTKNDDGEEILMPTTFINASSVNLRHQLRPRASSLDPGFGVIFDVLIE